MFFTKHGRIHALLGGVYLIMLMLGLLDALLSGFFNPLPSTSFFHPSLSFPRYLYDALLSAFGVILSLSAALEFQHKYITNVASGTLDPHSTVTYGEMIEHSFYHALNLVQIVYLHAFSPLNEHLRHLSLTALPSHIAGLRVSPSHWHLVLRLLLSLVPTLPWLLRGLFPVNKFSDNYTKIDERSTPLVRLLYRIKKYQYVFYKHFLLHGLNISVAFFQLGELPNQQFFRLYWVSLNLSYVMEFFLQTLVKKKHMSQKTMLFLQKILMSEATLVAIYVLKRVNLIIALFSLALNFTNRKHDLFNHFVIVLTIIVVKFLD